MTAFVIRDATGAPVAIHQRIDSDEGKRFAWSLPDGTSGLDGTPVAELPLFGIERLEGRSVVVCEGEKAAESLIEAGIAAVGSVTGATATPSTRVLSELAGKAIFLWADSDEPGRTHMERIAERLAPIAASVRWIEPGDQPKGWDAHDALAELGPEAVRELIRNARDKVSSGPDAPSERKQIPFITARQLSALTPEHVAWILPGYIAAGATHDVTGQPKAGKSTLVVHLICAALRGLPFLGRPVTRTPVVMLTEQAPSSLRPLLARAGVEDADDLHLCLWRDGRGLSWPSIVEAAVERCRQVGARLLIVDTLPQWAGLRGDAENDSGAALEAMAPLQAAAADGLAVLIVRHDRKGGGAVGESGRGSSAFAGAVDVILALRRGDGESRPTIRHLHALSRFDDTPDELVIEMTEAGYVALGSAGNFAVEEAKAAVLANLGPDPLTVAQLVDATELKRTVVYAALAELSESGRISREGKGTRGDAHRYSAVASFGPEPIRQRLIGPDERIEALNDPSLDLVSEARDVFADMLPPAVPTDTSAVVRP